MGLLVMRAALVGDEFHRLVSAHSHVLQAEMFVCGSLHRDNFCEWDLRPSTHEFQTHRPNLLYRLAWCSRESVLEPALIDSDKSSQIGLIRELAAETI
jgi:hypothetical protein